MVNKAITLLLALVMGVALTSCEDIELDRPAAGRSDFEYLRSKGEIIVGYTVFAPMNYTDDNGNFTGFDTELSLLVAERLGIAVVFAEIDRDLTASKLASGTIDAVWDVTITEDNRQNTELTVPYLKNAQVVVMRSDAEYNDIESLIGRTVSVGAGSAGEKLMIESEMPGDIALIQKDDQIACLVEVASGSSDAAVLDLALINALIGHGTDFASLAIKDTLAEEFFGVAFRPGSDVAKKVSAIFAELTAEGIMEELADKYSLVLA